MFNEVIDMLYAYITDPKFKLEKLLIKQKRFIPKMLIERVIKLAKFYPEEAFLLVYQHVRKRDLFQLTNLCNKIYLSTPKTKK